ncbi:MULTISPECIES: hypothetical protein [Metallosphaera]|uniref:hypothetical protein n=3 Tax=Sulfolobaceae TaxID=118883 RepID=UPI002989C73C|nr:hypothetical protein [Metallosphaera sedula]MCP6728450.1 hypothetical protein [Metallosphaera sedula]
MKQTTKAALFPFVLAGFLVLLAIISALSQNVEATGVFLVMAIIFYILGARIRKKEPREKVEFLGGKGLFSSWYWFNEKGIWKDNKFFLPWTAISDILVLRTSMRYYNRSRTFTVLDATRPNPESVEFGTIKIVTNDGRQIEINEVVSPRTVVEFIKKTYLK